VIATSSYMPKKAHHIKSSFLSDLLHHGLQYNEGASSAHPSTAISTMLSVMLAIHASSAAESTK